VRPAIHIRVTSAKLQEKILLALENLPYTAAALSARPDLEVTDRLEEEDLKLPGMMMVTARTAGFATGALGRRLARLYANSREPGMDRVCPRRLLSGQNRSHFYFFASPCPLKDGYPDGAGLAGEYGSLFTAARQKGCQLVSIEVLSEGAGHDAMLAAGLAAAILSARAQTPELKVRVVSRSAVIRDMLTERF